MNISQLQNKITLSVNANKKTIPLDIAGISRHINRLVGANVDAFGKPLDTTEYVCSFNYGDTLTPDLPPDIITVPDIENITTAFMGLTQLVKDITSIEEDLTTLYTNVKTNKTNLTDARKTMNDDIKIRLTNASKTTENLYTTLQSLNIGSVNRGTVAYLSAVKGYIDEAISRMDYLILNKSVSKSTFINELDLSVSACKHAKDLSNTILTRLDTYIRTGPTE